MCNVDEESLTKGNEFTEIIFSKFSEEKIIMICADIEDQLSNLEKNDKEKFMKEITIEGADLAYEIGPKILKEFKENEFPLLFSVIKSICNNQKLEINW